MYPNSKRNKILGLISILDETIGKLIETLEKNELLKDTLIVFMSDVYKIKLNFLFSKN
jgi:arylsulfatase A-like enzyme